MQHQTVAPMHLITCACESVQLSGLRCLTHHTQRSKGRNKALNGKSELRSFLRLQIASKLQSFIPALKVPHVRFTASLTCGVGNGGHLIGGQSAGCRGGLQPGELLGGG